MAQNENESIFVSKAEWPGLEHNRWLIEKKHFPKKRLSTMGNSDCQYLPWISKRRLDPHPTEHFEFKPSLVVKPNKLQQTCEETPKCERKQIKHPFKNLDRHQRRHFDEKFSVTWDDKLKGVRTSLQANQITTSEYKIDDIIKKKRQILSVRELRNTIPVNSLGDKIYRYPTYAAEFFKEGGLISGSSNIYRKRTTARLNEVDFTVDKRVKWPMTDRTTWKTKIANENRNADLQSVKNTENWEVNVLKEARPDWVDPDDDEAFFTKEGGEVLKGNQAVTDKKKAGKK